MGGDIVSGSETKVWRGLCGGDGSCSVCWSRLPRRGDFDFERPEAVFTQSLYRDSASCLCRSFVDTMVSSLSSSSIVSAELASEETINLRQDCLVRAVIKETIISP